MNSKPRQDILPQAYDYLAAKLHSEGDLARKLLAKGYAETEVAEAIAFLRQEGYLDDRRYAETFIQNLMEYKSYGYYKIKLKMMQKRLPMPLIDEVLAESLTESNEAQIAERFLDRYPQKNKRQQAAALKNRGFRTNVIFQTLGSLKG